MPERFNVRLTSAVHNLLGEKLVESTMVGATHWEERGNAGQLPGATPTFFFAPTQIGKRETDWGPGVVMMKAMVASAEVAKLVEEQVAVEWTNDVQELATLWVELLDNKISPRRGLMVSLL